MKNDIKRELNKANIEIKGGKVAAKDFSRAAKILAKYSDEDVKTFIEDTEDNDGEVSCSDILSGASIGPDGIGMLELYLEKYHADASTLEDVKQAFEDAKSDIEEWVLPAIDEALTFIGDVESYEPEEEA